MSLTCRIGVHRWILKATWSITLDYGAEDWVWHGLECSRCGRRRLKRNEGLILNYPRAAQILWLAGKLEVNRSQKGRPHRKNNPLKRIK